MKLPAKQLKTNKKFKNFKNINLQDNTALAKYDFAKFHGKYMKRITKQWVNIPPEVPSAGLIDTRNLILPQKKYKGLRFYLKGVKCFDETGNGWFQELGRDEIFLGGTAVDETGDTKNVPFFKVKSFDDGDIKVYPGKGKSLQYFNIREGGKTFPKVYSLSLPMIEEDWGSLSKWYNKFLDLIEKAVKEKINEYIKAGAEFIGGATGKALGRLATAIVSWALDKAISAIKGWLDNDHIGTATIGATINSYSGNWVGTGTAISPILSRDYRGSNAHYRIYWYCELI